MGPLLSATTSSDGAPDQFDVGLPRLGGTTAETAILEFDLTQLAVEHAQSPITSASLQINYQGEPLEQPATIDLTESVIVGDQLFFVGTVKELEVLGQGAFYGASVAVDTSGQQIYWVSGVSIFRSDFDGGVTELFYANSDLGQSLVNLKLDSLNSQLFWQQAGTLHTARTKGQSPSEGRSVVDLQHPVGDYFDFDYDAGVVFWEQGNTIRSASIDDPGSAQDVFTIAANVEEIAIDAENRRIYWYETDGEIWTSPLSSFSPSRLAVGINEVGALAADPLGNRVYWTNPHNNLIQRVPFDGDSSGSSVETVVARGLVDPLGLALDPTSRRLYWADPGRESISIAHIDGSHCALADRWNGWGHRATTSRTRRTGLRGRAHAARRRGRSLLL